MGLADCKWRDSKRKCDGPLMAGENLEVMEEEKEEG